jgi:hypothetical protein
LDEAQFHGVAAQREQDRHFRYRRHRARRRPARNRQVDLAAPEFGRHFAQRLRIADRIVQFNGDVLALEVAPRAQPLAKPIQERVGLGLGGEPKNAINSRRILRERGGRTGHRSADKRNEISSFHAAQYGSGRLSRLEARIQIISRYP